MTSETFKYIRLQKTLSRHYRHPLQQRKSRRRLHTGRRGLTQWETSRLWLTIQICNDYQKNYDYHQVRSISEVIDSADEEELPPPPQEQAYTSSIVVQKIKQLWSVLLNINFWARKKITGSEASLGGNISDTCFLGSCICLMNISLHLFIICLLFFSSFWQTWEKDFPWQRRRIFNVTKLLLQSEKWTYSKPCTNWKVENLWRKCEK